MSRSLVLHIENLLNRLEYALFRQGGHPPALALVAIPSSYGTTPAPSNNVGKSFSLKELIGDGMLWAVPKHRRSVEKRLNRKFGYKEYVWKLLKIKTNLRSCNQCGHDHEVGILCPHCYAKVRAETEMMQDKIQEQLGLLPVEQDVVVLYEGERSEHPNELLNGKRIVEMQKPRPIWFTKNLMQKTTLQPASTTEVKPSDLG